MNDVTGIKRAISLLKVKIKPYGHEDTCFKL